MAKQGQLIMLFFMPAKWSFSKRRPTGEMRYDCSFPKNGRDVSGVLLRPKQPVMEKPMFQPVLLAKTEKINTRLNPMKLFRDVQDNTDDFRSYCYPLLHKLLLLILVNVPIVTLNPELSLTTTQDSDKKLIFTLFCWVNYCTYMFAPIISRNI